MKFGFNSFVFLCLLMISSPLSASDLLNPGGQDLLNPDNRQDLSVVDDKQNLLTLDTCDVIQRNIQNGFLDPTYKDPQDSVDGSAVAGANLRGDQEVLLPEEYEFDLFLDLAERAGVQLPDGFEAEGSIGTIRFDNENVFLNDHQLTSTQLEDLNTFCNSLKEQQ